MPTRQLVCLDEVPASDGSCALQAWVEIPPPILKPLTVEQAETVGSAFFLGLLTLGALKGILNPKGEP